MKDFVKDFVFFDQTFSLTAADGTLRGDGARGLLGTRDPETRGTSHGGTRIGEVDLQADTTALKTSATLKTPAKAATKSHTLR